MPPEAKVKLDSKRSTGRAGRALLAGQAFLNKVSPAIPAPLGAADSICWAVIDSGCSWHCHPHIGDLINQRPCNDTMAGIDGKPQRVKCIGDLPAVVRDSLGMWRRVVIRDVRCVPSFTDTLLSVDQFWEDGNVNCIFCDVRCIHVPGEGVQEAMDLPFARKDNLYRWAIIPAHRVTNSPLVQANERALKATIHRPKSTSFFNALPPNEQLDLLHRRSTSYAGWETSHPTSPSPSKRARLTTATRAKRPTPREYHTRGSRTNLLTSADSSTVISPGPSSALNTASFTFSC